MRKQREQCIKDNEMHGIICIISPGSTLPNVGKMKKKNKTTVNLSLLWRLLVAAFIYLCVCGVKAKAFHFRIIVGI